MFSIIYRTYRPGGFDLLADTLKNQTIQDYELIVVDDYKIDRKKTVKDYLEDNKVNIAHVVPSKKKCFPELAYNQNNQINTGLLLSQGDIIIIYDDYSWMPPDYLKKFLNHKDKFKQNYCIVSIARMWKNNRPRNNEGLISVWDPMMVGSPEKNVDCLFDFWFVPELYEVDGTAYPIGLLEEMNGFPECYDAYGSGLWKAFFNRAGDKAKYFVDKNIVAETINHRGWEPDWLWHCTKIPPKGSTVFVERENCFNLKERISSDVLGIAQNLAIGEATDKLEEKIVPPHTPRVNSKTISFESPGDEDYEELYGKYYEICDSVYNGSDKDIITSFMESVVYLLETGKRVTLKIMRGRKYRKYVSDGTPIDYGGKTILDIGADYGSTASFFLSKGAKSVVAVEPDMERFRKLQEYADETEMLTAINMKIVGANQMEDLLVRFKPDVVKLDCEGCEQVLADVKEEIARIPSMYVIEMHSEKIQDSLERFFKKTRFTVLSVLEWADTNDLGMFERTKLGIMVAKKGGIKNGGNKNISY